MTEIDVLKTMGELGARFNASKLWIIIDYVAKMLADERIVIIKKDGEIEGVAFCSLSNDYELYYKKDTWDYFQHDSKGSVLYLELLCCRKWTRELRKLFESEIVKKYPSIKEAVWHRWASYGDRKVIYKRRIQNV